MKGRLLVAALLIVSLACRPVLTIGWGEIAILIVLIVVLFGPMLFKLYQRLSEFQAWKDSKRVRREKQE